MALTFISRSVAICSRSPASPRPPPSAACPMRPALVPHPLREPCGGRPVHPSPVPGEPVRRLGLLASEIGRQRVRVQRPTPTEMAPLFPGCDYEHWLIVMDKPGGEGATKEQMIDCFLGSEEEAKKKIYNVSCERCFGFGCEIDEEISNKLEGLPGVLFVLPDSYVDAENKDYGVKRKQRRKFTMFLASVTLGLDVRLMKRHLTS